MSPTLDNAILRNEAQAEARKVARVLLSTANTPDFAAIRSVCEQVRAFVEARFGLGSIDLDSLIEYFVSTTNVFVAPLHALSDPRGHVDWLPERRTEIHWRFWDRYRAFLETIEELPEPVVQSVDVRTESILELLEDPARPGPWDRRGLVVGSVQSGKTGNFLGLACKALDSGYKLVVVLAGIHNSLRAQTQIRMEEGLLGYNTDRGLFYEAGVERVGVGKLYFEDLHVNSMTSRSEAGDFNAGNLGATVRLGETPFIVVVKKHSRILENLKAWLTRRNGTDTPDGRRVVRDIPMLLIDDEADHSSINTKKTRSALPDGATEQDVNPTTINMKIRELLSAFEKSAYVGYTATPFANIFVDPNASHERLGDDLFPRSFIVSLPPPDNYVSVEKVFGRDGDPDAGLEARSGLPLTRAVTDFDQFFPEKPRPNFVPEQLPESLRLAILSFFLVCAAREARGQRNKHNSMLIHVARYVQAQKRIVELVTSEVLFIQRRLAHERAGSEQSIRQELERLWRDDFVRTTRAVMDSSCPVMTWAEIEPFLLSASAKIRVLEVNGTSADVLDYERHRATGISVIAVGGDKLSRGLTLEGLSVSYYMRISKMYDSLLQMGRWFGYRPGFIDLCRIYTSEELILWYRHIALAEADLRREFERMAVLRATPEEYGLRVRTHPDGMLVTALNKSRASKMMRVSFEGTLSQCVLLDLSASKGNEGAAAALFQTIGACSSDRPGSYTRVWSGARAEAVCTFLEEFRAPMGTNGFDSHRIAHFVRRQVSQRELVNWTVALISGSGANKSFAGLDIKWVKRRNNAQERHNGRKWALPNSNVLNPVDQAIDFAGQMFEQEWLEHLLSKRVFRDGSIREKEKLLSSVGRPSFEVAMDLSLIRFETDRAAGRTRANQNEPTAPFGGVIRDMRRTTDGLLLLYPLDGTAAGMAEDQAVLTCAVSFPSSETASPIEYQVNEVYRQLQLHQLEEADDIG